jgi:hypothetical protein
MAVNPNLMDIIVYIQNNEIPKEWSKLAERYPARFFFYNDTRETKHYISSIRPNILKQHWEAHPYLQYDAIFYHDCDIAFTKPIHQWITDEMIEDEVWYGSDVRFYISHSYIKGKEHGVLEKMCDIMGLSEWLIEDNELNCIGAQYLMKNVTYEYWNRVESDCEQLFHQITNVNKKIQMLIPEYHELQIWCADMFAVLWGAWRLGYKTEVVSEFEFTWATESEADYKRRNIFHNAGIENANSGLFYKAEWMNKLPYNTAKEPKPNTASWYYWNQIQETAKISCLL